MFIELLYRSEEIFIVPTSSFKAASVIGSLASSISIFSFIKYRPFLITITFLSFLAVFSLLSSIKSVSIVSTVSIVVLIRFLRSLILWASIRTIIRLIYINSLNYLLVLLGELRQNIKVNLWRNILWVKKLLEFRFLDVISIEKEFKRILAIEMLLKSEKQSIFLQILFYVLHQLGVFSLVLALNIKAECLNVFYALQKGDIWGKSSMTMKVLLNEEVHNILLFLLGLIIVALWFDLLN